MHDKKKVLIADFRSNGGPILDVRSPGEFEHGHIPEACNLPLFSDEERAEIGTCYKAKGREEAIQLGFDLVGPRLGEMIRRAVEVAPDKLLRIHCSRGGLRSKSVAWCLKTAGFQVSVLDGGYKSYRRWVRSVFTEERRIRILGGLTGTGKTRILKALQKEGEQVIDLEGLANHRGSSFGGLGMPSQPSTQHYENMIAEELRKFDPNRTVWIESESGRVGNCWVPEELYRQMKSAPVLRVIRSLDERLDVLVDMYGGTDRSELVDATKRIGQNLGGERTKAAINLIQQDDIREACRIILDYYDRTYSADLKRRPAKPAELNAEGLSAKEVAKLITSSPLIQNTRNPISEPDKCSTASH